MRTKALLNILIVFTHIAILVLLNLLIKENTGILILFEIIVLISLVITLVLLQAVLRPVNLMRRGLNLLREEDFTTTLVETGHRDVDDLILVFNNMIIKLREEKITIREQNHFLDLLISSSPMGLVVTDFDDRITSMNPASEKILGVNYGDSGSEKLGELSVLGELDIRSMKFSEKCTFSKGNLKYLVRKESFHDQGFMHPFYLFEEMTDEIRKAEKQAYGKLIRMMAHEVNNTVGAVNSIISTVASGTDTFLPDNEQESVNILRVALERNNQLNRFMQNFSDIVKLPDPSKSYYSLNDSVNFVVDSYRHIIDSKKINIECSLCDQRPFVEADSSQMELVMANILKNSIEAINEGGWITVETSSQPIILRIRDNGPGISKDIKNKLFTPFFTTKTGGQGIGLTLVREILVNHGFGFDLLTTPDGLTEFRIDF